MRILIFFIQKTPKMSWFPLLETLARQARFYKNLWFLQYVLRLIYIIFLTTDSFSNYEKRYRMNWTPKVGLTLFKLAFNSHVYIRIHVFMKLYDIWVRKLNFINWKNREIFFAWNNFLDFSLISFLNKFSDFFHQLLCTLGRNLPSTKPHKYWDKSKLSVVKWFTYNLYFMSLFSKRLDYLDNSITGRTP